MAVKNISFTQRTIRIIIGLVLFVISGLLLVTNQTHLAIAFFGIGLIPFAIGLIGTCPVFSNLKQSSSNEQILLEKEQ